MRLPASGTPAEHKGTLFLNPGGPGQTGVGLSEIVFLLPPEIRAAFDFVSYDPRMPEDMQMFVVRFDRDQERIDKIREEVVKFLGEVEAEIEALIKVFRK